MGKTSKYATSSKLLRIGTKVGFCDVCLCVCVCVQNFMFHNMETLDQPNYYQLPCNMKSNQSVNWLLSWLSLSKYRFIVCSLHSVNIYENVLCAHMLYHLMPVKFHFGS
jgi:hypothetical protein